MYNYIFIIVKYLNKRLDKLFKIVYTENED